MFQHVGRRLALLNALVVIGIIVAAGATTYVALQRSLDQEIDNSLRQRIDGVQPPPFGAGAAVATSTPPGDDSENDDADRDELDRDIVQSGDTIVVVVDRDGNIVQNPRNIDLEGLPVQAGIDIALRGESDTRTTKFEGHGVRVMTVPIVDNGQVVGAIQALRNLREHETELALVRWMTVLGAGLGVLIAIPGGLYLARRAMRPINEAFARQRAFVADASHELRTPLTLIRANADYALMDGDKVVDQIRPELTAILAEVDRTDRLVDDLLTLARADAGRLHLDLEPRDLAEIVDRTVDSMRPLFAQKGVEIGSSTPRAAPVEADRDRLTQVLRILLDNALAYTPPGGSVSAVVTVAGTHAEVQVRDTGSGIAAEHLTGVFERFYRADRARSRAISGTGLGLPIAKALVEAHGGRIHIESVAGHGTTVTFTIPVSSASVSPEPVAEPQH